MNFEKVSKLFEKLRAAETPLAHCTNATNIFSSRRKITAIRLRERTSLLVVVLAMVFTATSTKLEFTKLEAVVHKQTIENKESRKEAKLIFLVPSRT